MPEALSKRFCLSEASSIACSFEQCRSSFTREALTFSLWFFSLLRQGKRERTEDKAKEKEHESSYSHFFCT
jgi:hypothetical protein